MNNISSLLSMSQMSQQFSSVNTSKTSATSQAFDFNAAREQAAASLTTFEANNTKVTTLKKDTADFLTQYTNDMNSMNTAASKLSDWNAGNLLRGESGEVTEESIQETVSAAREMVESHNNALSTLNDNAERGPAVQEQMMRMVDDPASQEAMAMVGISMNDDGTMSLDEEVLTQALSTENVGGHELSADILGDIARDIQSDAQAGLRESAQELVSNDIAQMQEIQNNDPIRSFAQSLKSGGSYALNSAAAGIMMNMLA